MKFKTIKSIKKKLSQLHKEIETSALAQPTGKVRDHLSHAAIFAQRAEEEMKKAGNAQAKAEK